MTWLIWRQHRTEALALALLVTVLAGLLLLLGSPMHALFPHGAAGCATPPLDQGCRLGLARLQQDYGYATPMLILFNLVPFAIGGYLGAPLVARELETGTWQLAWTQAVPRTRWLTAKLAGLGALAAGLGTAFAAVVGWYHQPLDLIGRFQIDGFDVSGIVPAAYALFAFALAVTAGVLVRRTLPALGIALVAFVAARVTVAGWLRPRFLPPVTLYAGIPSHSGEVAQGTGNLLDGIIDQGVADSSGHRLGDLATARWSTRPPTPAWIPRPTCTTTATSGGSSTSRPTASGPSSSSRRPSSSASPPCCW